LLYGNWQQRVFSGFGGWKCLAGEFVNLDKKQTNLMCAEWAVGFFYEIFIKQAMWKKCLDVI
jgi:hypothetical protein